MIPPPASWVCAEWGSRMNAEAAVEAFPATQAYPDTAGCATAGPLLGSLEQGETLFYDFEVGSLSTGRAGSSNEPQQQCCEADYSDTLNYDGEVRHTGFGFSAGSAAPGAVAAEAYPATQDFGDMQTLHYAEEPDPLLSTQLYAPEATQEFGGAGCSGGNEPIRAGGRPSALDLPGPTPARASIGASQELWWGAAEVEEEALPATQFYMPSMESEAPAQACSVSSELPQSGVQVPVQPLVITETERPDFIVAAVTSASGKENMEEAKEDERKMEQEETQEKEKKVAEQKEKEKEKEEEKDSLFLPLEWLATDEDYEALAAEVVLSSGDEESGAAAPSAAHSEVAAATPCGSKRKVAKRRPLPQIGFTMPTVGCEHVFDKTGDGFRRHLAAHGYAVLRGVLGGAGAAKLTETFWREMSLVVPGLQPGDPSTWNFPHGGHGICASYGIPQADFAWHVRTSPRAYEAFRCVFNEDDLVVSLDAVFLARGAAGMRPRPWLHRDQSPHVAAPSYQGVYSLFEIGADNGGTVLVPNSHLRHDAWEKGCGRVNFLPLPKELQGQYAQQAVKPWVPPDSLLVFNSRLIHAGEPSREERLDPATGAKLPSRIALAVAFCPKRRRSEATRLRKLATYRSGLCSSHWADDHFVVKRASRFEYVPGLKKLPSPPDCPKRLALL